MLVLITAQQFTASVKVHCDCHHKYKTIVTRNLVLNPDNFFSVGANYFL